MRHSIHNLSRKQFRIAGAVVVVLLMAALYVYMGQGRKLAQNIRHDKPLVQVMRIDRQDMMRHIALAGQTVADANIALAPKYTGRIVAVYADLGDHVTAGQVLMVQDMGDLDISIRESQAAAGAAWSDAQVAAATYDANYIKARNDLAVVEDKYERNKYLFSIGAISQDTLDAVKQEYMSSKASFEVLANQADADSDGSPASVASKEYAARKDEHQREALEKQRDDMILRAPRDGVIGYRAAEVGAIAPAGTKTFSLVDNSHINVDCTLSETDAAILQPGMEVVMTIDALGGDYNGRIIYVSPAMDDTSKTYQVRIELDESPDHIKAGLFAHTAIDILQREQTLFVPKEAVLSRNGRQSLFVLRPDGSVEEREVKLGLINDESEEVISGIEDGDVVVLTNQDKLSDGTAVQAVWSSDSEAGAAGAEAHAS